VIRAWVLAPHSPGPVPVYSTPAPPHRPPPCQNEAQHELLELHAADGAAGDYFGVSVDLDGGFVLVGAPGDDDNGPFSGSAYLFDATTGQQLGKLLASDGATADDFGRSVALDGDRAVVGAPYTNDWAVDAGSAYVFDVTTGQQLFELHAFSPGTESYFGETVAIGWNLIAVGAPEDGTLAYKAGAVYVFDRATGSPLFQLLASDGEDHEYFGSAVAVSGRYVLVGSPITDNYKGAVYVYDGVTGQELQKLQASDAAGWFYFGRALSAAGDRVAITASGNGGQAYLFNFLSGQELLKIVRPDPPHSDGFGYCISYTGELVTVGAPWDDLLGLDAGSAQLFDASSGQHLIELVPSDSERDQHFGASIAAEGDRAVFGASQDDDLGDNAGSVYVFDVSRRLVVTPAGPREIEGNPGGPFYLDEVEYTLHNTTAQAVDFLVTADVGWLEVTGGSGVIPAAEEAQVTVSLTASAATLGLGTHQGSISFENVSTHAGDTTRAVELLVEEGLPRLVHRFDLGTDPGWTREGSWNWGVPQGKGGDSGGGPDPSQGYTGENVFGFNLNGDYYQDMPMYRLTSGALDCSGSTGTTLRFWRWLNVEDPQWDEASVRASNDGSNWTTVWQNAAGVYDNLWAQTEYDISAVADGQSSVYLQWTMGPTDYWYEFSGWNIDDIELWSDPPAAPGQGFCFGDPGDGVPCPCNNDNDGSRPGSGCANGLFASGAYLTATGVASVTSDTLVLRTTHGEPSNSALYFQGTTDLSPGLLWGDGLRCTGGAIRRLQVRFADGDGSSLTTIPIGAAGGVGAGDTRYYQLWYRTIDDPPCGAGVNDYNSSNGYRIIWQP